MALVPGVAIEINDELSASLETASRIVIFGIIQGGSLAPNTPTRVFSPDEGKTLAGAGSQLAQMISAVFSEFRQADVTVIGMAAPAGSASTGTFTFGGAATTATPLRIGIEDRVVTVPVAVGDVGADIAASANTVLASGFDDLHVTAGAAAAVLTLTARSTGLHGDQIRLRNVGTLPPGVTSAVVQMAGGAGVPDLPTAIAAVPGVRYKYWVAPDVDSVNLAALQTALEDRWLPDSQIDGHAVIGLRDTVSNLASFALAEDTEQITVFGDPNWLANPWVWAGSITGERAQKTNPRLTLYNDDLRALRPPPDTEILDEDDYETLLAAGIATLQLVGGQSRVQRFVTLYKTNSNGQPSTLFYDAEVKLTAAEIRQSQLRVLKPEIGKVLVDNASDVDYSPDVAGEIIDPEGIRQILINQNDEEFLPDAWTEQPEDQPTYFDDTLQVIRSGQNEVTITSSPPITGTNYRNEGTLDVVFSFDV
jgi:phage tail sheath gpL-like